MIEPRLYRAAFLPAIIALALCAFSLENRPAPAPQGLAADVLFDGREAAAEAQEIATEARDRRAGTTGDTLTGDRVAQAFADSGFETVIDTFDDGGTVLQNVVGRRRGASRDQILVLAARDADSVPDTAGSATDTAALLELARVLEGRPTRRTLVLASVDGSQLGDAGARRLVDELEDRERVVAAVVVSDLGAARARGPLLVGWSNDASSPGIGLVRTAQASLREELGGRAGDERSSGQLVRLAVPVGIGAQGALLDRGVDAVRISGSGELPPSGPARRVDPDRLGRLGRATLRTVSAIDDARRPPEHGPGTYLIAARKVVPGWTLVLLGAALLLPAVVAIVDGFARANRRREAPGAWLRWVLAGALPFAAALALAELLVVIDWAPDPPPTPPAPGAEPFDGRAAAVLGVTLGAVGLGLLLVRRLGLGAPPRDGGDARRRSAPPAETLAQPGPAVALGITLAAAAIAAWILNPYAALLLVPAVHLWMLATMTELTPRRWLTVTLVAGGLVTAAAVAVYYMVRLSLDPLETAWYGWQLVVGHHFGAPTAILGCLLGGVLASLVGISRARLQAPAALWGERPPAGPSILGPGAYAGPGSLGGTDSALRR